MAKWCRFECNEVHNARVENWNLENPTVTVRLMCDDDLRHQVIQDLILFRRPYPFNSSGFKPDLFAHEVRLVTDKATYGTVAPDTQVIDYNFDTYVEVMYRILPGQLYCASAIGACCENQNALGILYVTESFEPEVDFLTFDYKHFYWKVGADCTPADPDTEEPINRGSEGGWRMEKLIVKRTVQGYKGIPGGALTWEGKVHDGDYISDINKQVFLKETLLFKDVRFRRGPFNYAYNFPTIEISADLIHRSTGWNTFPKLDCSTGVGLIEFKELCVQCDQADPATRVAFVPFQITDMSDFLFSELSPAGSSSHKPNSKFTPGETNTCP